MAPALLDTGVWDSLDMVGAALAAPQFTVHSVLGDVPPPCYPIIPEIGIEKHLSALTQVGAFDHPGGLSFDRSNSFQMPGIGPSVLMSPALLGGAASPFAMPFSEFAGGAAAQVGSMFQPASMQAMFGQIGSYTKTVLDVVAFQSLTWLDSIRDSFVQIGQRWSYMLCEDAAQAVQEGDQEELCWFTTQVLGLSAACEADVAIALWQGRWRRADEPFSYIRKTVANMRRNAFRRDNPNMPENMILLSLDGSRSYDEPLQDLIGELCPRFADIELLADLEQGCQRVNLPPEALQLIIARLQDFRRDEMAALFGWTPQQVARIWKAVERHRDRLRYFVAARL